MIDGYRQLGYRIMMIGFDTDFATWPAAEIVQAVDGFPFGVTGLVLRPSQAVS